MEEDEASAIRALKAADAEVSVDLGEVTVSLPAPGYSRIKYTTSPWIVLLPLAASLLLAASSPPEYVSMILFLMMPVLLAVWLLLAWIRTIRLARRKVQVMLNDRTVRFEEQAMPLEELYAVITTPTKLMLERKGAREAAVEIPADPIAQRAMQSLLYAMAHRRQAVARQEGHDALAQASRPPAALDALRTRR